MNSSVLCYECAISFKKKEEEKNSLHPEGLKLGDMIVIIFATGLHWFASLFTCSSVCVSRKQSKRTFASARIVIVHFRTQCNKVEEIVVIVYLLSKPLDRQNFPMNRF